MDKSARVQPKWFHTIRAKLLISFCLLFSLVLAAIILTDIKGIPYTPLLGFEGRLKQETFNSLELIADTKKERLLRWIEERRDNIRVLANNKFTSASIMQLQNDIDELSKKATGAQLQALVCQKENYINFVSYLDYTMAMYEVYDNIFIADAQTGIITLSTDKSDLGLNVFQDTYFKEALRTQIDYVGNIELDPKHNNIPFLHLSHVIRDNLGNVIAVLVMEVKSEDILKPMFHTGDGLGKEGEALLVNKDGVLLVSLKHKLADGSIAKPLEYKNTAKPAVLAASGKEGVIEALDYRGVPVLAACRYLQITPEIGWGLVVKRDKAELIAPLRQDRFYTFLLAGVCLLGFVGVTIILSRSFTRSLLALSNAAEKVSAGDYNVRVVVTSRDEAWHLAETFNEMVEKVGRSTEQLEKLVQERTNEFMIANEQLKEEIVEHKQTEEELLVEKDKVQQYLEVAGVMLLVLNADQTISLINRKGCEILGHPECNLIGQNWFENFLPENIREQVRDGFAKLILGDTGEYKDFENPVLAKNGELRLIAWHNTVLRDEAGKIKHVLSSGEDITERKKAEAALKAKAEEYKAIIHTTQDGFWRTDNNGYVKDVNNAYCLLVGYSRDDLLTMNIRDLEAIENPEETTEHIQHIMSSGGEIFETRHRRKDGKLVDVEVSTTYSPDGQFFAFMRDITQRKKVEKALKLEELRVQSLLELNKMTENSEQEIMDFALEDGIKITRSKVGFIGLMSEDESIMYIHAWSKETMAKCNVHDQPIEYPISKAGLWGEAIRLRRPFTVNDYQAPHPAKKGYPEKHVDIKRIMAVPVFYGNKIVAIGCLANKEKDYQESDMLAYTSMLSDMWRLIQKRRADKALQESRDDLNRAQAVALTGSWHLNIRRNELLWSDETYRMFGIPKGTPMTYESFLAAVHPDDRNYVARKWTAALAGEPYDIEHRIIVGNELKWVRERAELEFNQVGNLHGGFGSVQDITGRKQREEQIKARQQEIVQLNATLKQKVQEEVEKSRQKDYIMLHQSRLAAMGEMIGLIAHQWRQPISALNFLLYNIKYSCENNEVDIQALLEDVAEGTRLIGTMSATIDDFRGFFKPDKEKETFSVNKKIAEVLKMLQPMYIDKNITVKVNGNQELSTVGFPNEYAQVVLNIMNNAKDAIVSHGKQDEIIIDICPGENDTAVVKIKDNGGGIPENIIDRIFDPYFTTKEASDGTGLGLYISKVIIKDHMKGSVQVRNVDGGAEFTLVTPAGS